MKKFLLTLMLLVTCAPVWATVPPDSSKIKFAVLQPEPQHRNVSQIVANLLNRNHYKKRAIDDSLSTEMFDRYLKMLDANRMYFLDADIKVFEKYRFRFDEVVLSGNTQPAFDIFAVYEQRASERLEYVYKCLEKPFNFQTDEYLEIDREKATWVKTTAELDEIWRKNIKHAALNLKLTNKEWPDISSTLKKRYERMQKNLTQYESEDVFQMFMNALSESYDPHTTYFSPKGSEDFKIQMSQSLEGIGARLTTENDYVKVAEVIAGGPADKSGLLHTNDRIVGVGQDAQGEMVDVIGWRLDDVVQLIRGKKGTTVRLQVLPAKEADDAPTNILSLVRDKIKLEDQSAKGEILEIEHEGKKLKFGVIDVPTFYADSEGRWKGEADYKSTTNDVRKLVTEYKSKVDGIVIDLRRNGGGFLNEAVELTGLFINEGPVVQVRDTGGNVKSHNDTEPGQVYDGPLAVLVDRLSASASEIFAAAIQDYKRGVIIGSDTFGKGTVQNAIDLNQFYRGDAHLGQLKMTIAKFYRIDGRSTQHLGVKPDISFPSRFNLMDIGESKQANSLTYDAINPTQYVRDTDLNDGLLPRLNQQHNVRLSNNVDYAELMEDLQEFEQNQKKTRISLKEDVRKAEREKEKKDKAKVENAADDNEEAAAEPDSTKDKKKDLLLLESAHVLSDYIMISKSPSK